MDWRFPLVRPYFSAHQRIVEDFDDILESGVLTNFGPRATALERSVQDVLGVAHIVSFANGTTALMAVLSTLPDDSEVIVPSYTFAATIDGIAWGPRRLLPVYADISEPSLVLDPASVARLVTRRTSAIVPVHTFGAPCDQAALEAIAREQNLRVIYDGAHALGATSKGQPIGRSGDAHVFSLSATKLLPCGEGGLVATNDSKLFEQLIDLRNYGMDPITRRCRAYGVNGKLTELAAAIGLRELPFLSGYVTQRNAAARRYRERLSGLSGLSFQAISSNDRSTFKDFVVIVDPTDFGASRDELQHNLREARIQTAPYFWPPVHLMDMTSRDSIRDPLRVTERISRQALSLPMYSNMSMHEVDLIADEIEQVHRRYVRF